MIKLQKLLKEKNDKIQIPGVGVMSYDGLKKDVNKKVQDLLKRSKRGNHTGIDERQFKFNEKFNLQ